MKTRTLESIPVGTVATWIGKEPGGRDGETWRVWLSGKQENPVYLKIPYNPATIIAELAASQVGRAIGINIPAPYIVTIDSKKLPAESTFKNKDIKTVFACRSCGKEAKTFERLVGDSNTAIDQWHDFDTIMVFDEWIANTDRNNGNLVFDSETNTYWLIDHGRSLGDLTSIFADLSNPAIDATNIYANLVSPCDTIYAKKLTKLANQIMLKCRKIDFVQLDRDNHYPLFSNKFSAHDIANFLEQRIDKTVELLCKKIGHPMIPLDNSNI